MELWNEEINAKKIIAVKDPTHAVEKRKPEKIMSCVFDCEDLLCIYFFILQFQYSCLSNSNIHDSDDSHSKFEISYAKKKI